MLTTVQSALCLILISSLPLAVTQQQDRDFQLRRITERELQRSDLSVFTEAIHTGDPYLATVILQAGKTGDSFWIPYLKPLLIRKRRSLMDKNVAVSAQLALAKLGEREQLQEIGCEANFGSASIQNDAIGMKLKYVRGWFSIQILKGWIDESPKPTPLLLDRPGDEVFVGPRIGAPIVLPEIVSNPPFPAPIPFEPWLLPKNQEKLTQLRQGWVDWLKENENSLRKLTPLGDGLDLSRSTCKRVLAHDLHFDRSNLK